MTGFVIRRELWFVCTFLLSLSLLLPLRVAIAALGMPERGLAAREATGSLWFGELHDAQWGAARLGDVDVGLQLGPLLLGRAVLATSGAGSQGRVVATPWGFGFSEVRATLDTRGLSPSLPFTNVQLEDLSVHFTGARCAEASGLVRAQTSAEYIGIPLRQSLSGIARCEGSLLVVPLVSASGMAIQIKIAATGRYEADIVIRPLDPAVATILETAGFRRTSRGYVARHRGAL